MASGRWIPALLVFLGLAVPARAQTPPGQPQSPHGAAWAVLPMASEGVDPGVAQTFHQLLSSELASATRARLVPAPYPCTDVPCAHAAGARLGANFVVFGSLRTLGTKLLCTASVVDAASGQVMASQTATAERVEELDVAARQLAAGLVPPPSAPPAAGPPSAEAGLEEDDASVRRPGVRGGFSMRVGGIVPLSDSGYAGLGTGMAFDLGGWIEGDYFAIEPRAGVRFDSASKERGSYFEMPFDVGAYLIMSRGDVAPLVGGGVGLHYLSETRWRHYEIGKTVVAEHTGKAHDSDLGWAAHGRAGVLFFRTHRTRLLVSGEYNATFLELNGGNIAQSFVFGLNLIL
jgi:hypothetical protein